MNSHSFGLSNFTLFNVFSRQRAWTLERRHKHTLPHQSFHAHLAIVVSTRHHQARFAHEQVAYWTNERLVHFLQTKIRVVQLHDRHFKSEGLATTCVLPTSSALARAKLRVQLFPGYSRKCCQARDTRRQNRMHPQCTLLPKTKDLRSPLQCDTSRNATKQPAK